MSVCIRLGFFVETFIMAWALMRMALTVIFAQVMRREGDEQKMKQCQILTGRHDMIVNSVNIFSTLCCIFTVA